MQLTNILTDKTSNPPKKFKASHAIINHEESTLSSTAARGRYHHQPHHDGAKRSWSPVVQEEAGFKHTHNTLAL